MYYDHCNEPALQIKFIFIRVVTCSRGTVRIVLVKLWTFNLIFFFQGVAAGSLKGAQCKVGDHGCFISACFTPFYFYCRRQTVGMFIKRVCAQCGHLHLYQRTNTLHLARWKPYHYGCYSNIQLKWHVCRQLGFTALILCDTALELQNGKFQHLNLIGF
jgi:hypothetical protein